MLKGVAASSGIGIGTAVLIREDEIVVVKRSIVDVEGEKIRFQQAVEVFVQEIQKASDAVNQNVGESEAGILNAQIAIINDPELTKEVFRTIERQSVNAEYAFGTICDGYIALFSSLEDELIRARAADFRDIKRRLLSILLGIRKVDLTQVEPGSILVAEDISPSQAAAIDKNKVQAIVTQSGTQFSHIAIIARALQMPAVVSVDNLMRMVENGDKLIVDGNDGLLVHNPGRTELARYEQKQQVDQQLRRELQSYKQQETRTLDGHRVELAANLAMVQELDAVRDCHADGIGLFRTEFIFIDRKEPPSEAEQFEIYKKIVQSLSGQPVIVRTLDIGGDKSASYLKLDEELNPFLGYRGVRYCLGHTDLFKAQISALLRASIYGDLRIMIPLITSLTELRQVKALVEEVKCELKAQGVQFNAETPLGIMIETPAAVICADELAQEADFFSIGTNDLTQYTLAVDRGNDSVAYLYNHLHPAVLRMIEMTVAAAHRVGIMVGVCGLAAADTMMVPFLLGVGVDELSVSSGTVLFVRSQVNNLNYQYWKQQVPEILKLKTASEVAHFIRDKSSQ